MPKTLTHQDYEKLIAEAEQEFAALIAEAESFAADKSLAKSENADKKDEKKDEDKEEVKAEDKDEKKDKDKNPDAESHDYDEEDVEELQKCYSSMSKAEMELHKNILEKCYMAKCGEMKVVKSEDAEALKNAEETASLLKSELELAKANFKKASKEAADAKAEVETLKKSINDLTVVLNDFLSKKGPVRKAITSIEIVKKNESESTGGVEPEKNLSKAEIVAKLNKKASDPSLSKSDREAIDKYFMVEGTKLDTIRHLLS